MVNCDSWFFLGTQGEQSKVDNFLEFVDLIENIRYLQNIQATLRRTRELTDHNHDRFITYVVGHNYVHYVPYGP